MSVGKNPYSLAASLTQDKEPIGTSCGLQSINLEICGDNVIYSVWTFMVIMVIMMEISVISFAIYSGLHSGLLFDPMEAKRGMSLSFLFNVRKPDFRKAY